MAFLPPIQAWAVQAEAVESSLSSAPEQLPPIDAELAELEVFPSARPTQLSHRTARPSSPNGRRNAVREARGTSFGVFAQDGAPHEYVPLLVRSGDMSLEELDMMIVTEIKRPEEPRCSARQRSFRRARFEKVEDIGKDADVKSWERQRSHFFDQHRKRSP